ncbi:mannosyltransferase family protein [Archangium lansingense]|uniref:mannosyltransferase family protein n=1 Tax=Archangium lansingense TaxID=2995310 RepID=UPI003B82B765
MLRMLRDRVARSPALGWCSVAIGCWLVVGVSVAFLPLKPSTGLFTRELAAWPFLDGWVRWDARWYGLIAREGYSFVPGQQCSVAFFPLYPLLMRAMSALGLSTFIAGILLTCCCGLGGVIAFSRWARERERSNGFDTGTAQLATWLLLLWPYAFFIYGAVYSDALFFVLVVGAFLALEHDQVLGATVLGAIATACRPIAPAVVVGLLVRQCERRLRKGERLRAIDLLPALSALGLLAWMAYQYHAFDTPFAFVEAQKGWHQAPGVRTWLKLDFFTGALQPHIYGFALPHALLALLFTALAVPTARRLGWGYGAYSLLAMGMPLASSYQFIGLGRYALAAFPCFLVLADLLRARPRRVTAWLWASTALMIFMTMKFALARYVS